MILAVEENNEDVVKQIIVEAEASLGPYTSASQEYPDSFDISAKDLRKLKGLSPATKRKLTRTEKVAVSDVEEDSAFKKAGYQGQARTRSKAKEIGYYSAYDAFDVVHPVHNLDYLAALYGVSPTHLAAVDAKVANIVGLGYEFTQSAATKQTIAAATSPERLKEIRGKLEMARVEMEDYLDSLNSVDSFSDVLKQVWTDYETTGNGYIEIGRTATGAIGYLGHVASTTMRVRRQRDGFVQIIGGFVTYFRNYGDRKTRNPFGSDGSPNEIIHIKKYTPDNQFYGAPSIISALGAVAGDEFADRYNLDYFEYKAVPRYLIISRGTALGPQAERNVHEFFSTNLKGKNHRSLYIQVPPAPADSKVDFEIKPIEAGKQDMSFDKYHDSNTTDILTAHRTPRTKVGQDTGSALAASRDLDKMFKEQVTRPEQEKLEYPLNKIIHERTDIFDFQFVEQTFTDEETSVNMAVSLVTAGILTFNEAREKYLNLGPRDGGDQTYLDFQAQAAEKAAEQKAQITDSRARDQQRQANATDSKGEGRNAKGDGRKTP